MRRVGVHRHGYMCITGRLSKRVEFPAVLTVKFFFSKRNVAQRWEAPTLIVPDQGRSQAGPRNSDFPGDLGPRSR